MTATDVEAIRWWQDDPRRFAAECAAMEKAAPDLRWSDKGLGGWSGAVPLWPFGRTPPRGLADLVENQPLQVTVTCWPAHPMLAPLVFPDVEPPIEALGLNTWHLLPSGALCLFRGTSWWDPARLAADLVPKISGWYIEYHLMMRRCIHQMPDRGIDADDRLDQVVEHCAARTG
jgi:hypothetical protein